MSATFYYEVVKSTPAKHFAHGTSSDYQALVDTFPQHIVSSKDIPTLRAMHRASGQKASLWDDISERLTALQGDDYATEVRLKIWVEY